MQGIQCLHLVPIFLREQHGAIPVIESEDEETDIEFETESRDSEGKDSESSDEDDV